MLVYTITGMVTAMDQSVGTILSALRKYKMLGNTIIVFTTDNGGAANIAGSNLPLRGSKTTLWEGGTRGVGFVYSKRLFKRKYVHEGLFHAVDWVPTLLAAAGGKQDKKLDGINQWPMLRGGKPSRRNGFVYSISETSAAIRMGDYKLIVGSPGIYNQWFTIPKTKSFCNSGEVAEDIFLYDNLNNAVRNIKSYISWFGSTLPGYSYWRHYKRLQALQKCKQKAKEERQKWVFPKFLLYNIKEDPTETKNLAGSKPMVFRKLKSRLERNGNGNGPISWYNSLCFEKIQNAKNTIIVFTTDNGGAANIAGSNLPLRGSKTTLWEGGTLGVCFVYSKRLFKRKYVHEGLFHAVDWVPTLLAAAGGKQDKKLDGINQWPMLRGGKPSRRNGFVYSISETSRLNRDPRNSVFGRPNRDPRNSVVGRPNRDPRNSVFGRLNRDPRNSVVGRPNREPPQTCPSTHAKCRDGIQCFPLRDLCDGDNTYCLDQSDEDPDFCRDQNCEPGYTKCRDGVHCFMSQWLCDRAGTYNCPDHSDEDPEFCKQQSCPEFDGWDGWNGWRKCRDGKQCFNANSLCNGVPAYCKDESDLDPDFCKNQTCGEGYIKCRDGYESFP
ncbi:Hypothetical predicted protein [Mytilus galloprovincialis]|uniref:Sulfatase N-terminal domain-containing protein n=1 Tax=Mytilus galloprovincialis TaxID=29158 RepID=A0A8B6FUP7_MYTGA|nr:Hypothetical predicted protein [Mytilus galloprovincialis]